MAQLSIIELIVRTTAVQLNIPESIVEKIIHHKHKSVHDAQYQHNTIEDSGLGTFKVRHITVVRRIQKIEQMLSKLQGGEITLRIQELINNLLEEKIYLESKI